ncbi:MAG: DAK2 domain-containing protein, partial [Eubacteriales bacterium]
MKYKKITGTVFKEMMIGAVSLLEKNKETLNNLNVFPVPDGDTGTNMSMTMVSAIAEMKGADDNTVSEVADAVSMGALKGARGNSGVILSQIFRGFAKGLAGDIAELQPEHLAAAAEEGVTAAYKAVMKPKEGTILTVATAIADEAKLALEENADVYGMLGRMLKAGEVMLEKTPDMLPVLKEAGVVDAGGEGLLVIYRGFIAVLNGEKIDEIIVEVVEKSAERNLIEGEDDITFGYCTEFFIKHIPKTVLQKDVDQFKQELLGLGDSQVVVGDLNLIKVHVHTDHPGQALEMGAKLGELSQLKIDNMREQHREVKAHKEFVEQHEKKAEKPIAMVAVASGQGMVDIFKDFMVDEVIEGGQTMNPSAQVIADAVEKAPSR